MAEYPTFEAVLADLRNVAQREGLQYVRVAKAVALQRLLVVENELAVSHHGDQVAVTYDVVRCALGPDGGLAPRHREIAEPLLNADQKGYPTLDARRSNLVENSEELEDKVKFGETTLARREDEAFQELARVLISMTHSPCNPHWEEAAEKRRKAQARRERLNNRRGDALQAFRFGISRLREDTDEEAAMKDAHELLELLRKPAMAFDASDDPRTRAARSSAGGSSHSDRDPRVRAWDFLQIVAAREYENWALAIPEKPVLLGRDLFLFYLRTLGDAEFVTDADAKRAVVGRVGVIRTYGDLGIPYPSAAPMAVRDPDAALNQAISGSLELLARIVASLDAGHV